MNRKKRVLIVSCLILLLSLCSCQTHKHDFSVRNIDSEYLVSEADYTHKAVYYYSCQCGLKGTETFEYGNVLEKPSTNLIIFIGDGMGPEQVKTGSIICGESFKFDDWDYVMVNTNSLKNDKPTATTDSAASATALATGVLTTNGRIGRDKDNNDVLNIMEYAKSLGKATGIVTTDECYQATPSGFSVHANNRKDSQDIIDKQINSCIDLFITRPKELTLKNKEKIAEKYTFVDSLSNAYENIDKEKLFVLANYQEAGGNDKLTDAVKFAIDYLSQNKNGYVLMIEQGYVDHSCHNNDFVSLTEALKSMSEAVNFITDTIDENTKLIVTADHETGGLSISQTETMKNSYQGIYYSFSETQHTKKEVYMFMYNFKIDPKDYSSLEDKTKLKNCDLFKIFKHIIENEQE